MHLAAITSIFSLTEIYVVYMDSFDRLDVVAKMLAKPRELSILDGVNFRIGDLCSAVFKKSVGDNLRYRAVVIAVNPSNLTPVHATSPSTSLYDLRSLDYGCVESGVHFADLRPLNCEECKEPAYAWRVSLGEHLFWISKPPAHGISDYLDSDTPCEIQSLYR